MFTYISTVYIKLVESKHIPQKNELTEVTKPETVIYVTVFPT